MAIPKRNYTIDPLDYLNATQTQQIHSRQSRYGHFTPTKYSIDPTSCHHIHVHRTNHEVVSCEVCGEEMHFMAYISYMQRLIIQVHERDRPPIEDKTELKSLKEENKTLLEIIKAVTTES